MSLNITNSFLYGSGVFTTIAIYDGTPFLWNKHWRRLSHNASCVNVSIDEFSENFTKKCLSEALSENKIINGRVRITFFDETEGKIWSRENIKKTSLSIITGDLRQISDNFRLAVSPYQVNSLSPLAGIKSCNYLDKILALDDAKARGFDEAIQINERGEVASATMANVFWLKDDLLYTPSLRTGCLPGTTREFVMENLECREVETTMDELHSADAIFLTSAGLGVVQVAEFESRRFERRAHPILELLPKQN
ncbi:MAG: aminotransferase class IV [Pyrinomonadaceae bacterium]